MVVRVRGFLNDVIRTFDEYGPIVPSVRQRSPCLQKSVPNLIRVAEGGCRCTKVWRSYLVPLEVVFLLEYPPIAYRWNAERKYKEAQRLGFVPCDRLCRGPYGELLG